MRKSEKKGPNSKSPHCPIFKFFVVTREVICQKMAPILDPVNFFGVFSLLGHCGMTHSGDNADFNVISKLKFESQGPPVCFSPSATTFPLTALTATQEFHIAKLVLPS